MTNVTASTCGHTVRGPSDQPRVSSNPELGKFKESVGSGSWVLHVSFSCVSPAEFSVVLDHWFP